MNAETEATLDVDVSFQWDQRGRLTQMVRQVTGSPTVTTNYAYDALDRLIGTQVTTGSTVTQSTAVVYDGQSQLAELDLTDGGKVIRSDLRGPDGQELLAVDQSTAPLTVWMFADPNGSVQTLATVDGQGNWQLKDQLFDATGTQGSTFGDSSTALNLAPVIWDGAESADRFLSPYNNNALLGNLYELNGQWYASGLGRTLSQSNVTAASTNPYIINGNDPFAQRQRGIDWSQTEGPDAYSNWFTRGAGENYRRMFGDSFLLSDSWRAEAAVIGGITVSAIAGVLTAPVTVPGLLIAGAATAAIDYTATWGIGAMLNPRQINAYNPVMAAEYAAGGALTAGAFSLGGSLLRPVFSPLAGPASRFGQTAWQQVPRNIRGMLTQDLALLYRRATQRSAYGALDLIGDETNNFYVNVMKRPWTDVDPDNFFDVIAHANVDTLSHRGVPTSPEELAAIIMSDVNYRGQDIRLISCWSGYGGKNSYAQRLADAMGVDVKAAPGFVAAWESDGFLLVFDAMRNNDGSFVVGRNAAGQSVCYADENVVLNWITFSHRKI